MTNHNAEQARLCSGCGKTLRLGRKQGWLMEFWTCDTRCCPGNLGLRRPGNPPEEGTG